MRKYVAVLAACAMLAAMLSGCRSVEDQSATTLPAAQTEAGQLNETNEATEGAEATEGSVSQTEAPTESTEVTEVTEEPTEAPTKPAEAPTEAPTEVPTEPDDGRVRVYTKYGKLYYQDQWVDFMRTVQTEEGKNLVVSFVAEFDGVKYPLFQLIIGECDGDPIGQLTDDQGVKHNVFVAMEEIGELTQLTEGEQNRLFAMQEEINFIIENLE